MDDLYDDLYKDIKNIKVPEIDVDGYFDDLKIQIEKKGVQDDNILNTIKTTWRYINRLQINCLIMQRGSIEILSSELKQCREDLENYKMNKSIRSTKKND